jgi:hypothetical protein
MMKPPPNEVYYLSSGMKNRLYTGRGFARMGYNSVRYSWGTDAKVYRLVPNPNGPDVASFVDWEDVTEEFK